MYALRLIGLDQALDDDSRRAHIFIGQVRQLAVDPIFKLVSHRLFVWKLGTTRPGIRRMREEMASLELPEPEFREDGFSFVITLRSIAPRERG